MRILQLCHKSPWPPKDGGAIAMLTMAKGFSLLGHEVHVLAMNTRKHQIQIEEIPDDLKEKMHLKLADVPAKITLFGAIANLLFSKLPYNATRFMEVDFNRQLTKLLKETEFDLIQLEGLYLCSYIPTIREYSKAQIAYRAHNVEHEIWERTALVTPGLKRIYLKGLAQRIKQFELSQLNKYDLLVPITDRDGEILDQLGNKKPRHTAQTGIDLATLVPKAGQLEYPSLFHLGALDWAPNQEGLLWFLENVWSKLHKQYPNLKFYVAGRNAPEWLQAKLHYKNVIFLGEIEDAYTFMNSKAIMVVPLLSGSGMRVKIIEGLALGKAIVSTTIGAEGIAVQKGKHILLVDDADEFIQTISQLIGNRDLYDQLCKNAIDFIHEKFDNLAIAESLIDFYKQHLHG
ncbi:glycosyltransferase family 4 protein [Sunxiuqinia sp. sy24]|uniref:glycosyltransferase family 4 protein n=1 Tax=Sunxiuqinia sp. sy24 TaxID=3461495 RepID=UPI0040452616